MKIVMGCDEGFQDGVASAASEAHVCVADDLSEELDDYVPVKDKAATLFWNELEAKVSMCEGVWVPKVYTDADDDKPVLDFQQWLETPLVWGEDCAYWCVSGNPYLVNHLQNDLEPKVTLRDALANDLSLRDGRPGHYLHYSEGAVKYHFHFPPDYVDWGRLRAVCRDEWHQTVHRYYELLYQEEFGPPGNGRCHYYALRHGYYHSVNDEINRIRAMWIIGPNPLYWRRRRLYPHIDMNG
jgi:hypothetical protein